MGAGGSGTSTLASALAVDSARRGARTLLISTEPDRGVRAVLGLPDSWARGLPANEVRTVEPGLDLLEIDSLALVHNRFTVVSALAAAGGGHDHEGFGLPEPDELTVLPGVQEVLALGEIARWANDGRYDLVVVDASAPVSAFRTIAAPSAFVDGLDRVWPPHQRIAAVASGDPRLAVLVAALDRVADFARSAHALVVDRSRTAVTLAATDSQVGLAALRRVCSWAALAGVRLDSAVLNRSDGAPSEAVTGALAGLPVFSAPAEETEPVGADRLATLAAAMRGGAADQDASPAADADLATGDDEESGDPLPVGPLGDDSRAPTVEHVAGTGIDSVYTLRLYLPLADPDSLTLGRVEDDLVVGADGMRGRIRLASVLRRCRVADARFDGTDLVVEFVPDPAVWPR